MCWYLYVIYVSSTSVSNQGEITIFVILTKQQQITRRPTSSLYNKCMLLCCFFDCCNVFILLPLFRLRVSAEINIITAENTPEGQPDMRINQRSMSLLRELWVLRKFCTRYEKTSSRKWRHPLRISDDEMRWYRNRIEKESRQGTAFRFNSLHGNASC